MPFLAESGFTKGQSGPSPGWGLRKSSCFSLRTGKAGLTRKAEASSEAIPGWQTISTCLDPASRSQAGRTEGKTGVSDSASWLHLCHRGSGTKLGPAGPPRRESLTYSFNHRFLSVCCVPALSQESKTQKCTGESLPGKVHGDTPCDTKQQQRGKYLVQTNMEREEGGNGGGMEKVCHWHSDLPPPQEA